MTTQELKDLLIHKIENINDKSFLNAINTIIDTKTESLIYKTSPEQRERINEGRAQLKNGELFTNDQVEMEIEQWLKEK